MNNVKSIIIKGGIQISIYKSTDKYLCIGAVLRVCLLSYTITCTHTHIL